MFFVSNGSISRHRFKGEKYFDRQNSCMTADESYRKLSLSKQYFNCRTFTHNKEWKELQNEYVELFERGVPLIPHYFSALVSSL